MRHVLSFLLLGAFVGFDAAVWVVVGLVALTIVSSQARLYAQHRATRSTVPDRLPRGISSMKVG